MKIKSIYDDIYISPEAMKLIDEWDQKLTKEEDQDKIIESILSDINYQMITNNHMVSITKNVC